MNLADLSLPSFILSLACILMAAKIGGHLVSRFGQPAVLGELLAGIVLGNLYLFDFKLFEPLKTDPILKILSELGVLLLLFQIGLESTVKQMKEVGFSSLLVAMIGVVIPFSLGWLVARWLMPGASPYVHAFLGATLSATSVGITARVLNDMGCSQTPVARIILGAAVFDDVLGLVILAAVTAVISAANSGTEVSYLEILRILVKALLFLGLACTVGAAFSKKLFGMASTLKGHGVLLIVSLVFCFIVAWIASQIGLAPIVGAFAAGLILEDTHFVGFDRKTKVELEEAVRPIVELLAPIFFILMGMHTEVSSFANPEIWNFGLAMIAVAIVGKIASMAGVLENDVDKLSVGLGMIPRGEVGLIFANMGLALSLHGEKIVTPPVYSAIIVMVMVTTLVTPPLLKWRLGSLNRKFI